MKTNKKYIVEDEHECSVILEYSELKDYIQSRVDDGCLPDEIYIYEIIPSNIKVELERRIKLVEN